VSEASPQGPAAQATLDLHADLYRPQAVSRAVAAFAAVAACTVEQRGAYWRVQLTALGGRDAALLRRHLANWVLAASVAGQA
jgi:hypothetical protein